MGAYGGGQYELGVGRGQIQYLAALFHPDAPNDIAPAGYDALDPEPGLPAEPARPGSRADRVPPARRRLSYSMPPKQRQITVEQSRALAAMQKLESRSDEELEAETRFRAAAQAMLGARAAERMDAKRSREHFRAAIAAARPQERLQLRRMAEASLALAERRAGGPQGRGREARPGRRRPTASCCCCASWALIAPPPGSGLLLRVRGVLLVIAARSWPCSRSAGASSSSSRCRSAAWTRRSRSSGASCSC